MPRKKNTPPPVEDTIAEALNEPAENIPFEEPLSPLDSPLNEPVAENDIGLGNEAAASDPLPETEEGLPEGAPDSDHRINDPTDESISEPLDFDGAEEDGVPEQDIGMGGKVHWDLEEADDSDFEIPDGHAKQAADTVLGMADNVMAVGGGFFVKIKKHREFYDFEEIIQVIDEQNEKNIQRLKLDKEDKILLRPLLIAILKKRARRLTPEQQLMGAVLSILMKKVQVAVEMRAENELLVDRILDVIRAERGEATEPPPVEEPPVSATEPYDEALAPETLDEASTAVPTPDEAPHEAFTDTVLEVAADEPEDISDPVT